MCLYVRFTCMDNCLRVEEAEKEGEALVHYRSISVFTSTIGLIRKERFNLK